MNDHYVWHSLYSEAMLEPDPEKLPQRIAEAQAAISRRLEDGEGDSGFSHQERLALSDAQHNLRALARRFKTKHQG